MTKNKFCSAEGCSNKAIREIDLWAHSYFTEKDYVMSIYVCVKHLELEKNNAIKTRLLN